MKKALLLLLLFPVFANAQYNDGMMLWKEYDCYHHIMKLITANSGKVSDSCEPIFNSPSKDIYIVNRDYLQRIPDTMNGYTIHRINSEGDLKAIGKELKKKNAPLLFFGMYTYYLESFYFWVFPAKIKGKKIVYDSKVYKFHYYFHQENSKFEHTRNECSDWE